MNLWDKKDVAREVVKEIHERYNCDLLTASILARRGITEGSDILFFLENDTRYLHNPFLFDEMEDAVDRIYDAAEEGEKVLIFGDRDADGITSTTILHDALVDMGIDVRCQIPTGDDAYGLSMKAVEDFAADYGTLIITVDCGISNVAEIEKAQELGIDVIVVDHHNPQDLIPEDAIIINPKMPDCGYPFTNLAGCGVTYKLVTALRFAKNELYKQQISLLNVRPINNAIIIEVIKLENLREIDRLSETITPGVISINDTRLVSFLKGQQIFVWDANIQKKLLAKAFGNGVEFNFLDIKPEIAKVLTGVGNLSLIRLAPLSKIAKYNDKPASEIEGFFNIFVTFILKKISLNSARDEQDLQLVTLGTLADLMPLKNENRILIKKGLDSISSGRARSGLKELLVKQYMAGKKISTVDIVWNITPVLNAAGRLGKPETALKLFLEKDPQKTMDLASEIVQMNKDRKQLGTDGWNYIEEQARTNYEVMNKNLTIAADDRINRGVTGLLAAKTAQYFKVPAIIISFLNDETAVGSIRSVRGYNVTGLLEQCADLFIAHGGHNYAAGFTLERKNYDVFFERIKQLSKFIEFTQSADEEHISIDAELPLSYLSPDILKTVDLFEPYGEENQPLTFMAKKLKIINIDQIGKQAEHLKITLSGDKYKWPAVYWNSVDKLKKEFDKGDVVDVVFQISRNTFNGVESAQMTITDLKRNSN